MTGSTQEPIPPRDDLRDRLARALGRTPESIRPLGQGTDHRAYEVDGTLVARVATGDRPAAAIEREARLLGIVGPVVPVPVPAVVALDPAAGLLVTTRLPGTSLLDEPCPEPLALTGVLADLLEALHSIPPAGLAGAVEPDRTPPGEWLAEAVAAAPEVTPLLDRRQRAAVERFLARPAPAPASASVLCHLDLGAEHLLAGPDRRQLTGVIDWSDAAVADVAVDLGRLWRDLGPDVASGVADRLGLDDATLARAGFHARCALLEDLRHGVASGDARYRDAALAAFDRTFAGDAGA